VTSKPDQDPQASKDPLHGMTLKAILEDLVERHDWPWLAEHISLRCFRVDPSISSSLAFLRRTPWARTKVERLYIKEQRRRKRNARRKWRAAAKREHDAAAEAAAQAGAESAEGAEDDAARPDAPDA